MIGAFLYLAERSARNRLDRQFRRLRTPRYLIALLLGVMYLWAITEQQRSARSGADASSAGWAQLIAAAGVACMVAWAWLFGSGRRALAFSPADVTFLFAGPVTRRWLIQYKLLRSQLPVLFNVLLWSVVLSRERFGASAWLRALSLWVLLTTLSFHRLGASFVRSSVVEHGATGLRRRALSLALASAGIGLLGAAIWRGAPALLAASRGGNAEALAAAVDTIVQQPPLRWLLVPFELMVRPLTVPTAAAWLHAIWPAITILALHFLWVVRSDAAFEESAVEHTLAASRRGGRAAPRRTWMTGAARRPLPRLLRLAPTGWPAGAILWKSLVSAVRARPIRGALVAGSAAGFGLALLSFGAGVSIAEMAGWLSLIWGAIMLLVGPQWIRNDLRSDLPHFDLLRSYPLRGRSLLAAEAAGSALVLTAIQLALLAIAYLAFLGNAQIQLTFTERTLGLAAAVVYLPPVNYVAMLIQNGGAILFPAWVRSGPDRPGGIEAIGQNMLLIVAHAGVLAVLLALPAALATGVFLLLHPALNTWAETARAAVFVPLLALEARALAIWLGGVLEKIEPSAVGIGS